MKSGFYKGLKAEVSEYLEVHGIRPKADWILWTKFLVSLACLLGSYLALMTLDLNAAQAWVVGLVLSLSICFFFVNSMHDMVHGALTENRFLRDVFPYILDWIGPSSFIWRNKHNRSHHFHTNHPGIDNDLNVSILLRFSPHHPRMAFHRFQAFYITLAYCLQTLFWFYVTDFKNILRGKITKQKLLGQTSAENWLFVINKGIHITLALVIPSQVHGFQSAALGYLVVYGLASLLLALIFQVAHVFEGAKFHTIERFEDQDQWAKSQIEGTCVFDPASKFALWVYGGLNLQVVHHLFPEIAHTHYYKIFPIIRKHCQENGIELHCFESFSAALKSHYRQLHRLGTGQANGDLYA
ncbi:MAG: acyl-CoA desaturase [Bdellovibrionales bacterium]|nr:acyl-CoA desaturase [Bdellovibrionales bacterium]